MSSESRGLDVAWDGGGRGRVVSLEGDAIVVRSDKPFAPGSRPSGALGVSGKLRMKTHRCQRIDQSDGMTFTLEGRPLDLTRDERLALLALLQPAGAASPK